MSSREMDLTKGDIYKTMLKFAVPFLLAILLQACYGAADLLIVGQFAGSVHQSAVATGTQVTNMFTNLITGLATGGTILVGHYIGEGNRNKASKMIGTCFTLFIILAAVFTVVLIALSGSIVEWMNAPAEAAPFAKDYIFICSCGIFFIFGYNAISGILRGLGDSKSPLIFVAIACVINIGLDIVLVSAGMGASGAATATITSQGISMILAIVMLKKRDFIFDFKLKSFRTTWKRIKTVLRVGVPMALQNSLVSVSFIILTAIVNVFGVEASAAVGILEKYNLFFMLPAISFSMAISAMVAQNMGAGIEERARKCFHMGLLISLAFGIVFFFLFMAVPENLMGVFTKDPGVVAQGLLYIKSFSWDFILVAFVFCFNGFVNGTGHTEFTLINNCISTFGVRVPAAFILSSMAGATLYEIGYAAPIASVVQIIIIFIYYRSGRWRRSVISKGVPA